MTWDELLDALLVERFGPVQTRPPGVRVRVQLPDPDADTPENQSARRHALADLPPFPGDD